MGSYRAFVRGRRLKLNTQITNYLKEVIAKHTTVGRVPSAPFVVARSGKTISLNDEGVKLLSEGSRQIIDSRKIIREGYTEGYVYHQLIDIVVSIQGATSSVLNTSLPREVKRLLSKLQSAPNECLFLVPVVNLKLTGLRRLLIGETSLHQLNPSTLRHLESRFKSVRMGVKGLLAERLAQLQERNIHTYAVVKANVGEIKKGEDLAISKVELSLDVLRLYNSKNKIGVPREFAETVGMEDIHYVCRKTGRESGASYYANPPSKFSPFVIDAAALDSMRKKGKLAEFSRLLREESVQNADKLAPKLLTALHWYGLSVKDERRVDKFVKLVVALEALLLENDDVAGKKQKLAERAAFILGKDMNTRNNVHKLVVELYGLRNEIVHEGRCDVREQELLDLTILVRSLIFAIIGISSRRKSLKEIEDRIKEIEFSSHIRGV